LALDFQYISKKYRGAHLVWLQKSNTYLILRGPAFDILTFTAKGSDKELICNYLKNQYDIPPEHVTQFVEEFQNKLASINETADGDDLEEMTPYKLHCFNPYSQRFYKTGDKIIEFTFETPLFESYLHPLIAHLEVEPPTHADSGFEMFGLNRRIVLRRNNTLSADKNEISTILDKTENTKIVLGTFKDDETHLLKGKIFIQLASTIYDVPEEEWLMLVHASALTNEKKTILFTASPGGGKSTLAAILQKNGYRLVSDDFVPIDKKGLAYCFPAAVSIKEGALKTLLPYYPSLSHKPETIITPEKRVRYLAQELNSASLEDRFPVSEVIFIGYNPKIPYRFRKLRRVEGISQFLEQAYIKPDPMNAKLFIKWALRAKFYQLTYSNNESAIKAISNLFDDE
jgi:hypothetical protein